MVVPVEVMKVRASLKKAQTELRTAFNFVNRRPTRRDPDGYVDTPVTRAKVLGCIGRAELELKKVKIIDIRSIAAPVGNARERVRNLVLLKQHLREALREIENTRVN